MPPHPGRDAERIRIKGARQNNLKGFDLDLPTHQLIVVTGLSGSGKSSLAFDTLYAEGQRRYIETFSPYARQFFDRMDKPRVDAIEGIPPAVALEQRNSVRTTRSTVGTMTEVCDHLKVLWPRLAHLHCRQCGDPVSAETPRDVWEQIRTSAASGTGEALVSFDLVLSDKLSLEEQLSLVARQGFQRLLLGDDVVRIDELAGRAPDRPGSLTVVQDRVRIEARNRARFVEACEQAYHFGHGRLSVHFPAEDAGPGPSGRWPRRRHFSRQLHCARCDLAYRDPTPALFSFNHPVGACPECKGFGRIIAIDYDRAVPDVSKSLADGAVRPWQTGMSAECQKDLLRAAKAEGIPTHLPFRELSPAARKWVIEGDPAHGEDNPWPNAWYGVKGYFRWLESKAYKMHVRVLLSRYRAYRQCPSCRGRRLQPDALLWRLPPGPGGDLSLADLYAQPILEVRRIVEGLAAARPRGKANDPFALALDEVRARLAFLDDVGVGYLTLDRPTRTLSGGETQRVNLTTCLGSRLVNTLFVLDEPSVGLHARDTERLVRILHRLRDLGNTVVVVEHETAIMRAADRIVDLGPGHGDTGGEIVANASYPDLLQHPTSLTAAFLSGRRRVQGSRRRPVGAPLPTDGSLEDRVLPYRTGSTPPGSAFTEGSPEISSALPWLRLRGVSRNNLTNLDVDIPLGRLVCLTGVSGSGKTTLAGELLRQLAREPGLDGTAAANRLEVRQSESESEESGDSEEPGLESAGDSSDSRLEGAGHLGAFLLVDQAPIGRTPRSNPAVYTGAFEHLREVFAQTELARERGLGASAFSFNSAQGQCEQCRGTGFEKIEMQFLSDVYIRCPACNGRRYRAHLLDVRIVAPQGAAALRWPGGLHIAEALELTVDDALEFLAGFATPASGRAAARLRLIQEVGLGYLRLGQPINTLSGGESQRLKLAGHLAGSVALRTDAAPNPQSPASRPTLFLIDEPTTGLHAADVETLLAAFQRLVDAGHTVLVIEHNLELVKSADWIIDLGPGAGAEGGRLVASGTPESVAECAESHTGRALRPLLGETLDPPSGTRPGLAPDSPPHRSPEASSTSPGTQRRRGRHKKQLAPPSSARL